ncbi:MAG: FkbM family methyltransferase [Thermodesulfobacteriota bacterium]|nr:FkbM family methyltransferase [Thermodesulfobacteriota bacterium]
MKKSDLFSNLFKALPKITEHHAPDSELHIFLKLAIRKETERTFSQPDKCVVEFEPFGDLIFPYHQLGDTISTLNLFDLDELIIFSFYWANRNRYRKVLDLGANLGLHSIIMSKCGYKVTCYEPDPVHFKLLNENFSHNNITDIRAVNMAISDRTGKIDFIRVVGNTMSSHVRGSKNNPYGELEYFKVNLTPFRPLLKGIDFVKMDIEGQEKEALSSTVHEDWINTDAMIEIQDQENADIVFHHFKEIDVNLFSQKKNWKQVIEMNDMPTSYHEGSLFISCKPEMPWSS